MAITRKTVYHHGVHGVPPRCGWVHGRPQSLLTDKPVTGSQGEQAALTDPVKTSDPFGESHQDCVVLHCRDASQASSSHSRSVHTSVAWSLCFVRSVCRLYLRRVAAVSVVVIRGCKERLRRPPDRYGVMHALGASVSLRTDTQTH